MIVSIFTLTSFGCCFFILNCFNTVYGFPTTYDQRQDGNLNLAAKLENIMVVVALPGKKKSNPSSSYNDALESYLTLAMNEQGIPLRNSDNNQSSSEENYEVEDDDDNEEQESVVPPSVPVKNSSTNNYQAIEETEKLISDLKKSKRSIPETINLQSTGNLFDNELPSGEQNNGNYKTGDNNEVFESFHQGSLKLIGDGIEDCGPERRRDSYGVCQSYSE